MSLLGKIKEDHENIRKICDIIIQNKGTKLNKLKEFLENLRKEIILYTKAEEEVLLGYIEDKENAQKLINDILTDHKRIDDLITEIYNANKKTTGWLKKLETLTSVLNDYFHKVENELFNEAYNIIPMRTDMKLEEDYVRVKKKKKEEYDKF